MSVPEYPKFLSWDAFGHIQCSALDLLLCNLSLCMRPPVSQAQGRGFRGGELYAGAYLLAVGVIEEGMIAQAHACHDVPRLKIQHAFSKLCTTILSTTGEASRCGAQRKGRLGSIQDAKMGSHNLWPYLVVSDAIPWLYLASSSRKIID